jgi:hypothetical protein
MYAVSTWVISFTLSQRGVRLSVNWVNVEWDSTSTESTRVRLHVNWVNAEDTNIYEDFIILHWLSWRGVSLRVDSVDVESHLAFTQLTRNETPCQLSHRRMLKNSNKLANSRTKSKLFKSLIIWPVCVRQVQKTKTKKSHASVSLSNWPDCNVVVPRLESSTSPPLSMASSVSP